MAAQGEALSARRRHSAFLSRRRRSDLVGVRLARAPGGGGLPVLRRAAARGGASAHARRGGLDPRLLHRHRVGLLLRPVRPALASALPARVAARMARLVAALAFALLAVAALAQYPMRPVRVLIPQPPGGANDTVARVIAPALGERVGQPLVIEN